MKKLLMTLTLALAAAIAIPAAAQSTTPVTQPVKECCKEKKTCCKEEGKTCTKDAGKPCSKEGKVSDKEGKKKLHKTISRKPGMRERNIMDPKSKDMRPGKMRENPMLKGISLTTEQEEKVKALREKNLSAEKQKKADMKAKSKEEMQKLRADFDKEMEKILDKGQMKQYKANQAEMEARRAAKQAKKEKKN